MRFHKNSKKKIGKKKIELRMKKLPELEIQPRRGTHKRRKLRMWRISGIAILIIIAIALINYNTTLSHAKDAKKYLYTTLGIKTDEIIARVNKVEITQLKFEKEFNLILFMRGIPPQYSSLLEQKMVLEQMITEELLLQEARKNNITISEERIDEVLRDAINRSVFTEELLKTLLSSRNLSLRDLREYYKKNLVIIALLNKTIESRINITDFDTTMFYNESIERYTAKPGQIRLRQIVTNSSENAEVIMNELKGGSDFISLAHAYSIDADSAPYGGDLGFVGREDIEEIAGREVADAAFSLRAGEMSNLIRAGDKYYILKREADIIPYEELEAVIREGLKNAMRNTLLTEYMVELRNKAKIEYHSWAVEQTTTQTKTEEEKVEEVEEKAEENN